jgi:hypothetical protein
MIIKANIWWNLPLEMTVLIVMLLAKDGPSFLQFQEDGGFLRRHSSKKNFRI